MNNEINNEEKIIYEQILNQNIFFKYKSNEESLNENYRLNYSLLWDNILFLREELYTGIGKITFKKEYGRIFDIKSHIGEMVVGNMQGEMSIILHVLGVNNSEQFKPIALLGYASSDNLRDSNSKFLAEFGWILCSDNKRSEDCASSTLWIPELNIPEGELWSIGNRGIRTGEKLNEYTMSNIKTEDIDKIPDFLIASIGGITTDYRLDSSPLNVRDNHFLYLYDDIPKSINDTNLNEYLYVFTRGNQFDDKKVHKSYGKNYSIKLSLKTSDSLYSSRPIDYKSVINGLLNIHANRKEIYSYKAEVVNEVMSQNLLLSKINEIKNSTYAHHRSHINYHYNSYKDALDQAIALTGELVVNNKESLALLAHHYYRRLVFLQYQWFVYTDQLQSHSNLELTPTTRKNYTFFGEVLGHLLLNTPFKYFFGLHLNPKLCYGFDASKKEIWSSGLDFIVMHNDKVVSIEYPNLIAYSPSFNKNAKKNGIPEDQVVVHAVFPENIAPAKTVPYLFMPKEEHLLWRNQFLHEVYGSNIDVEQRLDENKQLKQIESEVKPLDSFSKNAVIKVENNQQNILHIDDIAVSLASLTSLTDGIMGCISNFLKHVPGYRESDKARFVLRLHTKDINNDDLEEYYFDVFCPVPITHEKLEGLKDNWFKTKVSANSQNAVSKGIMELKYGGLINQMTNQDLNNETLAEGAICFYFRKDDQMEDNKPGEWKSEHVYNYPLVGKSIKQRKEHTHIKEGEFHFELKEDSLIEKGEYYHGIRFKIPKAIKPIIIHDQGANEEKIKAGEITHISSSEINEYKTAILNAPILAYPDTIKSEINSISKLLPYRQVVSSKIYENEIDIKLDWLKNLLQLTEKKRKIYLSVYSQKLNGYSEQYTRMKTIIDEYFKEDIIKDHIVLCTKNLEEEQKEVIISDTSIDNIYLFDHAKAADSRTNIYGDNKKARILSKEYKHYDKNFFEALINTVSYSATDIVHSLINLIESQYVNIFVLDEELTINTLRNSTLDSLHNRFGIYHFEKLNKLSDDQNINDKYIYCNSKKIDYCKIYPRPNAYKDILFIHRTFLKNDLGIEPNILLNLLSKDFAKVYVTSSGGRPNDIGTQDYTYMYRDQNFVKLFNDLNIPKISICQYLK